MKTITSLASLIAIASAALQGVSADQHFIAFLNSNGYLSVTGQMVVPDQDLSGTPYLWPGLQPSNEEGVLQPVLDGRNGGWFFGINYVGTPSGEPYGGGVGAPLSSTLGYVMRNSNDGNNNWYNEVSNENGDTANHTYDLGLEMTQAVFDCELYDVDWNFGDVIFKNIQIVGYGTDSGWCTNSPYSSSVNYKIDGLVASNDGSMSYCNIDQITLSPPS